MIARRIGVVEPAQAVQHVADVVGMIDHPGRILSRNDTVIGREVELGKGLVRGDEIPEGAFRREQRDDIAIMLGMALEVILQPPPEIFLAP